MPCSYLRVLTSALGGWGWKWDLGAFIAGVPVQPVLIRYPNSLVSLVEGRGGAGGMNASAGGVLKIPIWGEAWGEVGGLLKRIGRVPGREVTSAPPSAFPIGHHQLGMEGPWRVSASVTGVRVGRPVHQSISGPVSNKREE